MHILPSGMLASSNTQCLSSPTCQELVADLAQKGIYVQGSKSGIYIYTVHIYIYGMGHIKQFQESVCARAMQDPSQPRMKTPIYTCPHFEGLTGQA